MASVPGTGVRSQRQMQTRQRLLDASRAVFARSGFDGATVPEIARVAGVSTGAIYSNFAGKEELFLTMVEEILAAGSARRERAVSTGGDLGDVLQQMAGDWVEQVDAEPDLVLLMVEFWLYSLRRAGMEALTAGFLAEVRRDFVETLQAGVEGLPADRLKTLAAGVQALAYGFAMQRVADPTAVSAEQLGQAMEWLINGARA